MPVIFEMFESMFGTIRIPIRVNGTMNSPRKYYDKKPQKITKPKEIVAKPFNPEKIPMRKIRRWSKSKKNKKKN